MQFMSHKLSIQDHLQVRELLPAKFLPLALI